MVQLTPTAEGLRFRQPADGVAIIAPSTHPRRQRPPSPPPRREAPLLGNLTQLAGGSSRYVKTHVGVEAAAALVLAAVLTVSAVGCVVRAFCGYSLCCMGRDRKGKVRSATPRGATPRGYGLDQR